MGEMRDSDWSRENLLRSDWSVPKGAIMTTQGHGACLTPKEGLAGFQGRDKIEGAQKTLDRLIRVDQLVPFALPHFDDCVTRSEQGHAFG